MPDPTFTPATTPGLDAARVLRLAAQSLFDTFGRTAMGTMVVDREHRIVWIDDGYRRFLPALGHAEDDFIGRRVEEVVPNTLMGQVIDSGQAILVDLLSNQAGTFLVTRLPLRNDAGVVIGAVGFVLLDHPETTMLPLMQKFSRLQQELDSTRHQLAQQIAQQQAAQRRPKHSIASFIGTSPAALEVKRQARRVAQIDSTVLLLGETGTGKELLAHGVHGAGRRAAKPFVGVNIAAVPDTLLEAEFFGVAPGAFTGAERKGRDGKFKVADGGTLFLDEIGDMPLALQAKLLRALQEGEIEPLGSNKVVPFDARVIAATSRDLTAWMREGRFREDLYYRLNVLPIHVPPLRERRSDIPALVEALGDDVALRNGAALPELTADALDLLCAQNWRGNIRELRNVLEQTAMRSDSQRIDGAALQQVLRESGIEQIAPVMRPAVAPWSGARQVQPAAQRLRPLAQQVAEVERLAIAAALVATGGNKLAAARILGMSRATLYMRLGENVQK